MRNAKGFTLIEVLSVVVIVTMLAVIGGTVYMRAKDGGKKTDEMSQLKQIALAAAMYHDQYDSQWPNNTGSLVATGMIPKEVCKSPLDKSREGISNRYLAENAKHLKAYKTRITPFPNTYICLSDFYLYRREKMNALLAEQANPGLFVSLVGSTDLWGTGNATGPFGGSYRRATLDGSVITRQHRAFQGKNAKGEEVRKMSDETWFFDPSEEWIRNFINLE